MTIETQGAKWDGRSAISENAFDRSLGAKLKSIRKACSISQEFLGNYLGVHQTAVCRIETGDQTVTPQQLDLLSRLYEVKIDDLIYNENLNYPLISKKHKKKIKSSK